MKLLTKFGNAAQMAFRTNANDSDLQSKFQEHDSTVSGFETSLKATRARISNAHLANSSSAHLPEPISVPIAKINGWSLRSALPKITANNAAQNERTRETRQSVNTTFTDSPSNIPSVDVESARRDPLSFQSNSFRLPTSARRAVFRDEPPDKSLHTQVAFHFDEAYPIYKNRIYFMICRNKTVEDAEFFSLTTDRQYVYHPFCEMIKCAWSPEAAWEPFGRMNPSPFPGYRDATYNPPSFVISILDCLRGLRKALDRGIVNFDVVPESGGFDLEEYEHYDDPLNGDLHKVVAGKFVAFKGPIQAPSKDSLWHDRNQIRLFDPKYYVTIFQKLGVKTVIRLNEQLYDRQAFLDSGIDFEELYFDDCTTPSVAIVQRFFEICARAERKGAIAIHCKAGLGRTGTLIALWLMRKHRFSAREAIGWLRIARPGSIIGDQQHYLCSVERSLRRIEAAQPTDTSALPAPIPPAEPPATLLTPSRPRHDRFTSPSPRSAAPTATLLRPSPPAWTSGAAAVPAASEGIERAAHGSESEYVAAVGGSARAAQLADQLTAGSENRARRRLLQPLHIVPPQPAMVALHTPKSGDPFSAGKQKSPSDPWASPWGDRAAVAEDLARPQVPLPPS